MYHKVFFIQFMRTPCKKYDNALVIVSIGEPILYQGRENRYYKFVSTVIPFVENAD